MKNTKDEDQGDLVITPAHATDPGVMNALDAMLVDPTHTSKPGADLPWSSPDTWVEGTVPEDGATVLIPAGSEVEFDSDTARIFWLRVKGDLCVGDEPITANVETLMVEGSFIVGEPSAPRTQPFELIFSDSGPINTAWDATTISRGMITMGTVKLVGEEVTPIARTAAANPGDMQITLLSPVKGWAPGQRILLPGVTPKAVEDEVAEIAFMSPDGLKVMLKEPLEYPHPSAPLRPMPVGNLTRKITFRSESTLTPMSRGHIMIMHPADLAYVALDGIGRQDKLVTATDPPNIGNTRGRYACHIHKMGVRKGVDPVQTIKGCVVENNPGWGYVIHSSQAEVLDCIAYNVVGSGFVSEAGDEVGGFRRCLVVRTLGDGKSNVTNPADERGVSDFGFGGQGFWLQGGGMVVEDCIGAGTQSAAYVFMGNRFKIPGGTNTKFPVANLPPQYSSWVPLGPDKTYIWPDQVPCTFRRNVCFATHTSMQIWAMGGNNQPRSYVPGLGIFEDSYFEGDWENPVGFGYSSHQTMKKNTVRPYEPGKWQGVGMGNTGVNTGYEYIENDIRGFSIGIHNPTNLPCLIKNNTLQALTGINLRNTYQAAGRTLTIEGNNYLTVPAADVAKFQGTSHRPWPFFKFQGKKQMNVCVVFNMATANMYDASGSFGYWTSFFKSPNGVDRPNDKLLYNGKRMFLREYDPTFVVEPLIVLPLDVRQRPNGTWRTTADLQEELGLYLGGVKTPPDAVMSDPMVNGILGNTDRTILPTVTVNKTLVFYQVTNKTTGFMLKVKDKLGAFKEFGPFVLIANVWNFPIITIDGIRRGIPVFCDMSGAVTPSPW